MGAYFSYYLTGFIMIPVFLFALMCQAKVRSAFSKYSNVRSYRNMTGAEAAQRLLIQNGITDVTITQIGGNLTDNYNPRNKVISLSSGVYNSTSIAAISVACHEAGHACQHAQGYFPLRIRNVVIPATNIGSYLGVPLALVGMFIHSTPLIYAGMILYGLVALFQFLTLPVEFNASNRALKTIESSEFLTNDELKGAKKVLSAAALTYVAALASALATLLRLFLIANRNNR